MDELPRRITGDGRLTWRVVAPDRSRCSASWFVSTHGRDVYIVQRGLGGVMKVSLHEGGEHRVAFVSNDVSKEWQGIQPDGSRIVDSWERGPELVPGWTKLYEVIHPETELRTFQETGLRDVIDLEVSPGHSLHVVLLEGRTDAEGIRAQATKHLATFELDESAALALVAMLRPRDEGLVDVADDVPDFKPPERETDPASPGLRLSRFGVRDDGSRFVIDAAGGPSEVASPQ